MNKFLNFLLLLVAIGGIAAGGFALYKNLNSDIQSSVKTSEEESENNNSQINNTAYKEKVYNIGNDQYLAFTNNDLITYDYSINTEKIKVLTVIANISKGNLNFDSLKANFKYSSSLNYQDYLTVDYIKETTTAKTIVTFTVTYNAYRQNKIPSTITVALNSTTNAIHPCFDIRCNDNAIDRTSF